MTPQAVLAFGLAGAAATRLGQEFLGHAGQIDRGVDRLRAAQEGLAEVALGGTAVGTGLGTHPAFAHRVTTDLAAEYAVDLRETGNHFQAQNNADAAVFAARHWSKAVLRNRR